MIFKKENVSSKNSLKKRISFSIWLVWPWFSWPVLTNGKRPKNNKIYPYSLGKLFIYLLFIPKWFLLLASTITICNIALLSSTETGRKFSICHTVKPVMERGGYYFTNIIKLYWITICTTATIIIIGYQLLHQPLKIVTILYMYDSENTCTYRLQNSRSLFD